jgi:uncharacterized protein YuzE
MKVRIDRDADVLWIEWGDPVDSYADEVSKNVYLHYTPQGEPVALEVLFLSRGTHAPMDRLTIEYAPPGSSELSNPISERMNIEFGSVVKS